MSGVRVVDTEVTCSTCRPGSPKTLCVQLVVVMSASLKHVYILICRINLLLRDTSSTQTSVHLNHFTVTCLPEPLHKHGLLTAYRLARGERACCTLLVTPYMACNIFACSMYTSIRNKWPHFPVANKKNATM